LDYSREKVRDLYQKAGIQVPNSVKKLFGITTKNKAVEVATKVPELKIVGDKIDSRQCLRYTKVALVDIARRLRLKLPLKVTKPILCDLIKSHKKMPAELLANIRTGKKLVNVKRQLAAIKIQKAFRARARVARKKAPPRVVAPVAAPAPKFLRPTRRPIPKALAVQALAVQALAVQAPAAKKTRRTKENIYRQLDDMYAKGQYASINNFNYANQEIVEQYYTNKGRLS
jgi:hypothetical protein